MKLTARLMLLAILAVLALLYAGTLPAAAQVSNVYGTSVRIDTNGLKVGSTANAFNKFQVAKTTGAISAIPTATSGVAHLWDYSALTSGQGAKLKYVGATLNGGYVFSIYDGSTVKYYIAEGGAIYAAAGAFTVDSAGNVALTSTNAASGSANPWDYTATLGIMNGSDTFQLFDINMTNANHTGSTNVVEIMNIANITGDANAQENAFTIGSGWDVDLNGVGGLGLGADDVAVVTVDDPPAAGASGDLVAIAATLAAENGSDTVNALSITLTNADHTSTGNAVNGINIATTIADAHSTETALNIATGWDSGLTNASPTSLSSTLSQTLVNGAGASANPYDYTGTLGIMDGNDDFTLFDVNATNADHTGSSNTIQVLDIAAITGDAQATETAVNIGSGWDAGITSASLVNFDAGIACDVNAFAVADTTGVLTLKGAATIDNNASAAILNLTEDTVRVTGILDVTSTSTLTGAVAFGSTAKGPGNADPVVYCTRHRVTAAEINAGHSLLPAITGRQYRLINCKAIAYGGSVEAVTTVDILGTQSAGSVKLVAYAQANLTRSAVVTAGGTGGTVLADGASFAVCDANTAITINKTGDPVATATGVDVILEYVVE